MGTDNHCGIAIHKDGFIGQSLRARGVDDTVADHCLDVRLFVVCLAEPRDAERRVGSSDNAFQPPAPTDPGNRPRTRARITLASGHTGDKRAPLGRTLDR